MVFSSIPAYLDPSNWQPQQINHQGGSGTIPTPHLLPPPPPPQPAQPHVGSGGGLMIRPGSMVERARLANIPMPDAAQKCPRCESTNTKFCYYNNYSLSQPRHFCKTCRRYWTRGGALRSVPVGGGCRRNNKRSNRSGPSSSSSKSTSSAGNDRQSNSSGPSSSTVSAAITPPIQHLPFIGQLADHHHYTGISPPADLTENMMTLQLGGGDYLLGASGGVASLLSGGGGIQQSSQFPFLDPLYNFHAGFGSPSGFIGSTGAQFRPRIYTSMLAQLASVKSEGNNNNNNNNNVEMNSINPWGSDTHNVGAWSDISASFSSSSTSNNHL